MADEKKRVVDLVNSGRLDEALPLALKVCESAAGDAEAWAWLGVIQKGMGAHDEADTSFRHSLDIDPAGRSANSGLADILAMRGQYAEAIGYYRKSLQLDPKQPGIWINLGGCLQQERRIKDAVNCYEKALQLNPGLLLAHVNLALLFEKLHEFEETREHAEHALQIEPRSVEIHMLLARLDCRARKLQQARKRLEALLGGEMTPYQNASLLMELGSVLDKCGEYSRAFESITTAKQLFRSIYNVRSDRLAVNRRGIDKFIQVFRQVAPRREAENVYGNDHENIVFLVGFPRSGTTLTEQMLESHPDFVATHELPVVNKVSANIEKYIGRPFRYPDDMDSLDDDEVVLLRKAYRRQVSEGLGLEVAAGRYVLDKFPLNIVHLGLVARMFPGAKILLALRDPRDVCLSCYMQNFEINPAMAQFLDIRDTAEFYAKVMGLWLHYRDNLGLHVLETRYEDIVADLEGTARRLLDFIGVEWNSDVLRYYELARNRHVYTPSYQGVTQPIYQKSIGRWKNYKTQLAPIMPVVEPYLRSFGYIVN